MTIMWPPCTCRVWFAGIRCDVVGLIKQPRSPVYERLEERQQKEGRRVHRTEQRQLQHVVVDHHADHAKSRPLRGKKYSGREAENRQITEVETLRKTNGSST